MARKRGVVLLRGGVDTPMPTMVVISELEVLVFTCISWVSHRNSYVEFLILPCYTWPITEV